MGSIIVIRTPTHREQLIANTEMDIVLEDADRCLVTSFGIILEFHELCNESDCGHVVSLLELL